MEISASYPIIKGDGEFISKLNAEYKANAETFAAEEEKNAEDAKLLHEQDDMYVGFYDMFTEAEKEIMGENFNADWAKQLEEEDTPEMSDVVKKRD